MRVWVEGKRGAENGRGGKESGRVRRNGEEDIEKGSGGCETC